MRNLSLDYFKVFLAFCVVLLHGGWLYDISELAGYLHVNGFFRIAVPLFFIINGYYFYNISSLNALKKWSSRVFLLYVIWTIIYLPVMIYSLSLSQVFICLFTGYFVLWYLIAMLVAGLLLFFLKKYSDKFLILSSFILLFLGYLIQSIGTMSVFSGFIGEVLSWGPFHRNFIFFGFPFMTIGYLIRKNNIDLSFKISILLSLLFLIILFLESYVNYKLSHKAIDILLSLSFLCPIIFLIIKKIKVLGSSKNIANFSTGIFLIHAYVLFFLRYFFSMGNTLLCIFTVIISCFASLVLIQINKKFKFLL